MLLGPSDRLSGELAAKVFGYYGAPGQPIGSRKRTELQLQRVESSLHPVEEIMSVPGAHAVPPLVQPTAALDSAVGAVTIGGNPLLGEGYRSQTLW
jgi:hypothetical protein